MKSHNISLKSHVIRYFNQSGHEKLSNLVNLIKLNRHFFHLKSKAVWNISAKNEDKRTNSCLELSWLLWFTLYVLSVKWYFMLMSLQLIMQNHVLVSCNELLYFNKISNPELLLLFEVQRHLTINVYCCSYFKSNQYTVVTLLLIVQMWSQDWSLVPDKIQPAWNIKSTHMPWKGSIHCRHVIRQQPVPLKE